jgi:hypothetical protein
VKTFVITATVKIRVPCLCFAGDADGDLIVGFFLHNTVQYHIFNNQGQLNTWSLKGELNHWVSLFT